MLILPAIDLLGGKCVRLTQGDYGQSKVYDSDPAEVARRFADEGAPLVHVVDLDGAKAGRPINLEAIEQITSASAVPIEVGGGVRNMQSANTLFEAGVARVILGTSLISNRELAAEMLSTLGEKAVAGIDARNGVVSISGWTQQSEVAAVDVARWAEKQGARRIILTDIATDGMLSGPNLPLLTEIANAVSIPVIASGGVATLDDLARLARLGSRIEGAIVGKALYEGRFTVREAVSVLSAMPG